MLASERIVDLQTVSDDRSLVALSLERLRRIDQRMASAWKIDFHAEGSLEDVIPPEAGPEVSAYWAAHDAIQRALESGAPPETLAPLLATFHDALATPQVFGLVTATRRALILDSLALAIGLVERLHLTGPILDAGCHTGFVASLLADELPNRVVGIDPSVVAIEVGRTHASMNPRVELQVGSLPWTTDDRFDFIIAVSSMPSGYAEMAAFLRGLGGLLTPGGFALVTWMGWRSVDVDRVRVLLKAANLGFAYADVAGGYMGLPPKFEVEDLVVLVRGSDDRFPRNVGSLMEREWDCFRDYANNYVTSPREKTQAFERAARLEASKARTS